jgi:hypothetical protein
MSESGEQRPVAQVREVIDLFSGLRGFTEVQTDHLPVVFVAPIPIQTEADVATDAPAPVAVDDYVPEDVKQRLIYHWLRFGPDWRADIVEQAPPMLASETPEFNPLRFPRPRLIGHLDDGISRVIRPKER